MCVRRLFLFCFPVFVVSCISITCDFYKFTKAEKANFFLKLCVVTAFVYLVAYRVFRKLERRLRRSENSDIFVIFVNEPSVSQTVQPKKRYGGKPKNKVFCEKRKHKRR